MSKKLALGLLASLSLECAAFAASSTSGLYGNTVAIWYPDKTSDTLYLLPDGAYRLGSVQIGDTEGTWEVEGDKVCLTQTTPATTRPNICLSLVSKKPGDSWQDVGRGGQPVTIEVDKGM